MCPSTNFLCFCAMCGEPLACQMLMNTVPIIPGHWQSLLGMLGTVVHTLFLSYLPPIANKVSREHRTVTVEVEQHIHTRLMKYGTWRKLSNLFAFFSSHKEITLCLALGQQWYTYRMIHCSRH